jgi:adenylate cyclase
MAKEIERKFLVDKEKLPPLSNPQHIIQGYIPSPEATVRVRVSNDKAFLTLKGKTKGITRSEFEYPIPLADAKAMLEELCVKPYIQKRRYLIPYEGHTWELDIFEGHNEGLIVAEIELSSEDEVFSKPVWVKEDVSNDKRYKNSYLVYKHHLEKVL